MFCNPGAPTLYRYPWALPIINAGADAGSITGWTSAVGTPQASAGPGGDGTLPRSGGYFFYAGNVLQSDMYQEISVPSIYVDDIDAGKVSIKWSWWLCCGTQTPQDTQRISISFYNASSVLISTTPTPYRAAGGSNHWVKQIEFAQVPVGTRTIRLTNQAQRTNGTSNDGDVDDIESWMIYSPNASVALTIVNPGGESGSMTGWTTSVGTPSVIAGPSGDGTLPHSGSFFFYAGNVAQTDAYQDIAIPSTYHALVDLGTVGLNWSWWQCCTGTDQQRVIASFYNSTPTLISTYTGSYFSDGGANVWINKQENTLIPALTRTIRLTNQMQRLAGTSNDGYTDDISARLLFF